MYELLKGMTIVEGAAFIAGPSCGLYLAQMGAQVIRFDSIGGGPDFGRWPLGENGSSLYWDGLNKGKKSVAIALDRPEGRALAQRLAVSADGLFVTNHPVEGFLSYEKLSGLRPDLICLRVMGWADGTPAVDYTINAAVGVPTMTGHPDDARPVNHVIPAWDLVAGAYGAFSILAAERDRRSSGKGRELRLALSDLAATTLANLGQVAEVMASGHDRPRMGNDLFGAFGRDFPIAGGERLMIVAITPRQWSALVKTLGIDAAVASIEREFGASFVDEGPRFTHRDRLFPLVAEAVRQRTLQDLGPAFDVAGVCWSRYQSLSQACTQDARLFSANPIFSSVEHPRTGRYSTPGAAVRIAQDPRREAVPAATVGAHTDEMLSSLLNLSATEIGRLHDAGVVA